MRKLLARLLCAAALSVGALGAGAVPASAYQQCDYWEESGHWECYEVPETPITFEDIYTPWCSPWSACTPCDPCEA